MSIQDMGWAESSKGQKLRNISQAEGLSSFPQPLACIQVWTPWESDKSACKTNSKAYAILHVSAIHKEVCWCFDNVVWFYHPIPKLSLLNNSEESKYNNLMVEPAQMKFSKVPKSIFKDQFLTPYILRGFLRGCVKVCTSTSCTLASTPN